MATAIKQISKKKSVLGLDLGSRKMGVCLMHPSRVEAWTEDFGTKGRADDRFPAIYRRLEELITHFEPDLIIFENPYGASRKACKTLDRLCGAVMCLAEMNEVTWMDVNTSTWKKFAVKDGRANKEKVIEKAMPFVGEVDDNGADAWGVALYGYANVIMEEGDEFVFEPQH